MSDQVQSRRSSFASRVKHENEQSRTKPAKLERAKLPRKLLLFFGYFTAAAGLLISAGTFFILEATYTSLAGVTSKDIFDQLSQGGEFGEFLELIGMNWLPAFMGVYEYRFPITIGLVLSFGVLALGFFLLANKRKQHEI